MTVEPLPISIPKAAYRFRCGCDSFRADALPFVVATELRGLAGEILARNDEARARGTRLTAYEVAWVLTARADELEGLEGAR